MANIASLRHEVAQHHFEQREKHHIAAGDASFTSCNPWGVCYNIIKKGGGDMKKEILNGTPIPYELSIEELEKMLSSPIMKDFSLACEALSYKNDPKAYHRQVNDF